MVGVVFHGLKYTHRASMPIKPAIVFVSLKIYNLLNTVKLCGPKYTCRDPMAMGFKIKHKPLDYK